MELVFELLLILWSIRTLANIIKVVSFIVTPIFVVINEDNNLVCGEGQASSITMYPDKPFNIPDTVRDIESLGVAWQDKLTT